MGQILKIQVFRVGAFFIFLIKFSKSTRKTILIGGEALLDNEETKEKRNYERKKSPGQGVFVVPKIGFRRS